jgi:hypothetical protein
MTRAAGHPGGPAPARQRDPPWLADLA